MATDPNGASGGGHSDRLLPWIAGERAVRAVLLIAIGIVLATHVHEDYGRDITRIAQHLGFNPASNGIRELSGAASRLTPTKIRFYGFVAIAYGVLEGVEAFGLFRRRRWAEYLTVLATTLLFIPEIDELIKKPSAFKAGAFLVNVAIVVYLVVRLRRGRQRPEAAAASADTPARAP